MDNVFQKLLVSILPLLITVVEACKNVILTKERAVTKLSNGIFKIGYQNFFRTNFVPLNDHYLVLNSVTVV